MADSLHVSGARPNRRAHERDLLASTDHRPWPLPEDPWALRMDWTDLLFAHWPVPDSEIASLIPDGFAVDTYDGTAWVGVVPFRMERVKLRGVPPMPGANLFAEANVRTYVRDRKSGDRGVYFFSLDANNPLAVVGARVWYHLPYYFAHIRIKRESYEEKTFWDYRSERLFSRRPAVLKVKYRATSRVQALSRSKPGTIEHFLTERYALFTHSGKRLIRADVHHLPWPLAPAEAELRELTIAAAQGIHLPATAPLLHYSRALEVFAWSPKTIH